MTKNSHLLLFPSIESSELCDSIEKVSKRKTRIWILRFSWKWDSLYGVFLLLGFDINHKIMILNIRILTTMVFATIAGHVRMWSSTLEEGPCWFFGGYGRISLAPSLSSKSAFGKEVNSCRTKANNSSGEEKSFYANWWFAKERE